MLALGARQQAPQFAQIERKAGRGTGPAERFADNMAADPRQVLAVREAYLASVGSNG